MDEEQKVLLDAAEGKISVAEKLLDEGDFEDAVSRAYYGMFHAAKAVLLEEGSKPKSHQGVVSELGKFFRDRMDKELISSFSQIQTLREDADYEPYFTVEEKRAEEVIDTAKKFLKESEKVISD